MASFLFLLFSNFLLASTQESCHLSRIPGIIKDYTDISKANSALHCVMQSCSCSSSCAVSYHEESGTCRAQKPVRSLAPCEAGWISFANHAPRTQPRVTKSAQVLWLLDESHRGKNLGSLGEALDLEPNGITNWTSIPGPRTARGEMGVATLNCKSYVLTSRLSQLSLGKAYTLAFWLNVQDFKRTCKFLITIMQGYYKDNGVSSLTIVLENRKTLSVRMTNKQMEADVFKQPTLMGPNEWHHFAITLDDREFSVYRDGLRYETNASDYTMRESTSLRIGQSGWTIDLALSCIAVFDSALTEEQVIYHKDNCI